MDCLAAEILELAGNAAQHDERLSIVEVFQLAMFQVDVSGGVFQVALFQVDVSGGDVSGGSGGGRLCLQGISDQSGLS